MLGLTGVAETVADRPSYLATCQQARVVFLLEIRTSRPLRSLIRQSGSIRRRSPNRRPRRSAYRDETRCAIPGTGRGRRPAQELPNGGIAASSVPLGDFQLSQSSELERSELRPDQRIFRAGDE